MQSPDVDFFITGHLNDSQKEQLLEMYQNEAWSKTRTSEERDFILAHTSFIVAIVDKNNNLAAFARILTDYFKFSHVYDIMVRKNYRGQGLGRVLMEAITHRPLLKKVENLELVCLKDMVPFYKKFGFSDAYEFAVPMYKKNFRKKEN